VDTAELVDSAMNLLEKDDEGEQVDDEALSDQRRCIPLADRAREDVKGDFFFVRIVQLKRRKNSRRSEDSLGHCEGRSIALQPEGSIEGFGLTYCPSLLTPLTCVCSVLRRLPLVPEFEGPANDEPSPLSLFAVGESGPLPQVLKREDGGGGVGGGELGGSGISRQGGSGKTKRRDVGRADDERRSPSGRR
jgi:hypothetical protein